MKKKDILNTLNEGLKVSLFLVTDIGTDEQRQARSDLVTSLVFIRMSDLIGIKAIPITMKFSLDLSFSASKLYSEDGNQTYKSILGVPSIMKEINELWETSDGDFDIVEYLKGEGFIPYVQ